MSKSKKNTIGLGGRNALKGWLITDNIYDLMGKVLTIVDAATEGDKNKAIKDLIKDVFHKKHEWLCELCWKELEPEGSGHSPRQEWEDGLVVIGTDNKVYSFRQ